MKNCLCQLLKAIVQLEWISVLYISWHPHFDIFLYGPWRGFQALQDSKLRVLLLLNILVQTPIYMQSQRDQT